MVEGVARFAQQLDFITKGGDAVRQQFVEARVIQPLHFFAVIDQRAFARLVEIDFVFKEMVHAAQGAPHADRPGNRCAADFQHVFDFIKQAHRLASFAV